MPFPDNLRNMHFEEEQIRIDSILFIERSADASYHLSAIEAAMNLIMALNRGHEPVRKEERVVQYLGLLLFNASASCLRLGLSGYYQQSLIIVRYLMETVLLLDYLTTCPEKLLEWEAADERERKKSFAPAKIRKALDKRDGFTGRKRESTYRMLSEYAAHATPSGFQLIAPQGAPMMGPFFNTRYLNAAIEELVKFIVHGVTIFSGYLRTNNPALHEEEKLFLERIEKYLPHARSRTN
jgi:hypothetical protein